jgi:prolyl-tRNA editing enzyme YbaK/EbsC (Cys-tRNA(Pro) deacylase)
LRRSGNNITKANPQLQRISLEGDTLTVTTKKGNAREPQTLTLATDCAISAVSRVAQTIRVMGRNVHGVITAVDAESVTIIIDGALAMAVLPANRRVQVQDLLDVTGSDDGHLAHEDEFKKIFPDCETGAMPPFGNLYGMDVYISPELVA